MKLNTFARSDDQRPLDLLYSHTANAYFSSDLHLHPGIDILWLITLIDVNSPLPSRL